jgi:protein-S-isoprenylcysteine O-methyltransferase Ste14
MSEAITVFLWCTLFSLIHSFMVTDWLAMRVERLMGQEWAAKYSRLVFMLITFLVMGGVGWFIRQVPNVTIYRIDWPARLLVQLGQVMGLPLIHFARVDGLEFFGLRQAWAGVRGQPNRLRNERLVTRGSFALVRHPMYLGMILIVAFAPHMTRTLLVITLWMIAYCYVGSFIEERRLTQKFGDPYVAYRKEVSRLIPVKWVVRRLGLGSGPDRGVSQA